MCSVVLVPGQCAPVVLVPGRCAPCSSSLVGVLREPGPGSVCVVPAGVPAGTWSSQVDCRFPFNTSTGHTHAIPSGEVGIPPKSSIGALKALREGVITDR